MQEPNHSLVGQHNKMHHTDQGILPESTISYDTTLNLCLTFLPFGESSHCTWTILWSGYAARVRCSIHHNSLNTIFTCSFSSNNIIILCGSSTSTKHQKKTYHLYPFIFLSVQRSSSVVPVRSTKHHKEVGIICICSFSFSATIILCDSSTQQKASQKLRYHLYSFILIQ